MLSLIVKKDPHHHLPRHSDRYHHPHKQTADVQEFPRQRKTRCSRDAQGRKQQVANQQDEKDKHQVTIFLFSHHNRHQKRGRMREKVRDVRKY